MKLSSSPGRFSRSGISQVLQAMAAAKKGRSIRAALVACAYMIAFRLCHIHPGPLGRWPIINTTTHLRAGKSESAAICYLVIACGHALEGILVHTLCRQIPQLANLIGEKILEASTDVNVGPPLKRRIRSGSNQVHAGADTDQGASLGSPVFPGYVLQHAFD